MAEGDGAKRKYRSWLLAKNCWDFRVVVLKFCQRRFYVCRYLFDRERILFFIRGSSRTCLRLPQSRTFRELRILSEIRFERMLIPLGHEGAHTLFVFPDLFGSRRHRVVCARFRNANHIKGENRLAFLPA